MNELFDDSLLGWPENTHAWENSNHATEKILVVYSLLFSWAAASDIC